MSSKNRIKDAIEAALVAGKGDIAFVCYSEESSRKGVRKKKKRLNASQNWRVCKDTIWSRDGTPFNGIASWKKNVTVFLGRHEYRFRVLQLDRLGWRTYYAIPVSAADNFSSLPGIELNPAEITLIREMANELSTEGPVAEDVSYILHPAKPVLIKNRDQLEEEELDFGELLRMMKANHSFRLIVIAAMAAQYRSFLPGEYLPEGVYNFDIPPKSSDSDSWFYDILQAVTFVNNPGKNVSGPITITMKDTDDLKRWRRCYERLAVIRTATGALLWPLLEEIETSDQVLKSGGAVTYPLPTVPISLTRSYLHHPQAVDIPLPVETPQLTGKQLDLLRAAMGLLLKHKVAKAAFQSWKESRARPTAYRTNGFLDWHEQLLKICLETWFPGAEYQSDRTLILSDTQRQQAEQEQAIDEILRRSIDLLTDPSKYSDKIIERPASYAEWERSGILLKKVMIRGRLFWRLHPRH